MIKSKFQIVTIHCVLMALCAILLTSCDELVKNYVDTSDLDILTSYFEHDKSGMEVTDVTFSPDYKQFTVSTRLVHKGPGFNYTDTTRVRTEVSEVIDGIRHTKRSCPRLVEMKNVEAEGILQNDLRMLILVDRTLPQEQLDSIQSYVREMRTIFDQNHLFVAFMEGDKISKNFPVTDYILDAYFRHVNQPYIYLYRAMQTCREQIIRREDKWKGAQRCVMITFAIEQPYDDDSDIPYDVNHYRFEEQLVKKPAKDSTFLAFYVDMDKLDSDEQDDVQSVPYIFCNLNGGEYLWDYNWITLKRKIYDAFHFNFPDNQFTFVNPDFKVYRGDDKQLTLKIYDRKTDKVAVSFTTTVTLGQVYKPIIVHGHSIIFVLVQGILLSLLIFLFVFFVLQVVTPLIRYAIFRHKYVLQYAGPNMSVNNHAVSESCYLCKAPFHVGDVIVSKCEHTMHEACWEENGYHCPEYSDRCKHGEHYFNKYNLFDKHNASFYMKWVLMAIITAMFAWLGLTLYIHFGFERILPHFMKVNMEQIPFFGFIMSFFITLGIASFAINPHSLRGVLNVLLRTLIAASICYVAFFITQLFMAVIKISLLTQILNAIPWIISSFVVVICSTKYTRIVYNKRLVLLSVGIGFLSVLVWNVFYQMSELDYRVLILFSFLFYYVSMAVSVATAAPRSERYFLKVEGAVKTMDVALYKWLRTTPGKPVTIGKSVDCSLQLSWDIQSNIAPMHAEIRLIHKIPYLIALEPGVSVGNRPLRVNKKIRLYHGKQFAIGNTKFTYIEKDR